MNHIDDVREMHEEAERLEMEATDLRSEAKELVAALGLCSCHIYRAPCCGQPYDCMGPVR